MEVWPGPRLPWAGEGRASGDVGKSGGPRRRRGGADSAPREDGVPLRRAAGDLLPRVAGPGHLADPGKARFRGFPAPTTIDWPRSPGRRSAPASGAPRGSRESPIGLRPRRHVQGKSGGFRGGRQAGSPGGRPRRPPSARASAPLPHLGAGYPCPPRLSTPLIRKGSHGWPGASSCGPVGPRCPEGRPRHRPATSGGRPSCGKPGRRGRRTARRRPPGRRGPAVGLGRPSPPRIATAAGADTAAGRPNAGVSPRRAEGTRWGGARKKKCV